MANDHDATSLEGFRIDAFTSSANKTHEVYRMGAGPAVIVIHEVPGITPLVVAFARSVANRGMTAVVPDLLGTPGRAPSGRYIARSVLSACVSREFTVLALNKTSPITSYLRELATYEHVACGGPGVGAVGMCFTGGFALAMCVDDVMVAPVMSQPGLPLPLGVSRKGALGVSSADLVRIQRRTSEGLCVMGLRFSGDSASPPERFETLRRALGDNFIGVEIDSSPTNPWGYKKRAHSVLTEDYSDEAGSPTRTALNDVLSFLASRLGVSSTTS